MQPSFVHTTLLSNEATATQSCCSCPRVTCIGPLTKCMLMGNLRHQQQCNALCRSQAQLEFSDLREMS